MSKDNEQPNNEAKTTTSPNPPGGAAMLAWRGVARIGYGAMQLPGPGVWGTELGGLC